MSEEKAKTQSKHRGRNVRIKASVVWWKKVDALMAVNGRTTYPESFRATTNEDIDRTDLSQA
jgi:hypothetical protein